MLDVVFNVFILKKEKIKLVLTDLYSLSHFMQLRFVTILVLLIYSIT